MWLERPALPLLRLVSRLNSSASAANKLIAQLHKETGRVSGFFCFYRLQIVLEERSLGDGHITERGAAVSFGFTGPIEDSYDRFPCHRYRQAFGVWIDILNK